ncbi:hypothetical protein [Vibrio alfacsensis]|uniref:hypothetical protein n=1 Tax=Vibrio TaxID=662 RepID=UPI004068A97F
MNDFVLRLMKCARAYEAFIGTKLRSKQNINAEELVSSRVETLSRFPELKAYETHRGVESVELELFNKFLLANNEKASRIRGGFDFLDELNFARY